jgi:hypothetical protein
MLDYCRPVVDFQHAYVFGLFIFGMDIHVAGHVLNVLFFVFRVLSFFLVLIENYWVLCFWQA